MRRYATLASKFLVAAALGAAGLCGGHIGPAAAAGGQGYSGPYIGAALFYGFGQVEGEVNRISTAFTLPFSEKAEGFAFGGFAGYDWKASPNVVFGVLADIGATRMGARDNGLTFVASVRGRLGYLITSETLLYGTAGLGFMRQKLSGRLGGFEYDVSEIKEGFVWGGGIETRRLWGDHPFRIGVEVLRYDFNTLSFEVPDRRVTLENSSWTVGARLTFELDRSVAAAMPMK